MNRYYVKIKEINHKSYYVDGDTPEHAVAKLHNDPESYFDEGQSPGDDRITESVEKVFSNITTNKDGELIGSDETDEVNKFKGQHNKFNGEITNLKNDPWLNDGRDEPWSKDLE